MDGGGSKFEQVQYVRGEAVIVRKGFCRESAPQGIWSGVVVSYLGVPVRTQRVVTHQQQWAETAWRRHFNTFGYLCPP